MKLQVIGSEKFGWEGVVGRSLKIGKKASIEYIKISTPISERKSSRCDRTYFILSGTAEFVVAGKRILVKAKEAIRIPKNTSYSYRPITKIELVELNIPPYDAKYEEISNNLI